MDRATAMQRPKSAAHGRIGGAPDCRFQSRGDRPKCSLNERLKWVASLKPQEKAISLTL